MCKLFIQHSWDDATDIDDITEDQKAKALVLFKYLKHMWEHRTKHGTSETRLREAFSEFIILTGFMENRKKVGFTIMYSFRNSKSLLSLSLSLK